jgi:hypothetical protein
LRRSRAAEADGDSDGEFEEGQVDPPLRPASGWKGERERVLIGTLVNVPGARGYANAGNACAFNSVVLLIGASHSPSVLWQLVPHGTASPVEGALSELLRGVDLGTLTGTMPAPLVDLDVSPQDPILVMRRILGDDGEWPDSVSFMDGWS